MKKLLVPPSLKAAQILARILAGILDAKQSAAPYDLPPEHCHGDCCRLALYVARAFKSDPDIICENGCHAYTYTWA